MTYNQQVMKGRYSELLDAEAEGTITADELKEMDALYDALGTFPTEISNE
jgi:hypothetical protein